MITDLEFYSRLKKQRKSKPLVINGDALYNIKKFYHNGHYLCVEVGEESDLYVEEDDLDGERQRHLTVQEILKEEHPLNCPIIISGDVLYAVGKLSSDKDAVYLDIGEGIEIPPLQFSFSPDLQNWVRSLPVLVAAYYGDCTAVSLPFLVEKYRVCSEEEQDFEGKYPYIAENFHIEYATPEEDVFLKDILKNFSPTSHIQAWIYGDLVPEEELEAFFK